MRTVRIPSRFIGVLLRQSYRLCALADPQLGDALVEPLEEEAGLADLDRGEVAALGALPLAGQVLLDLVLDPDALVQLVCRLEPAEDAQGVLHGRLLHVHRRQRL